MPPEKTTTISTATLIPVGLLAAILSGTIGATVWLHGQLLSLRYGIDKVEMRLADLTTQLAALHGSSWTLADMRAWVSLTAARNSALSLPEPHPVLKPQ